MRTVMRIIGFRPGTGGSSGVGFLKQALQLTFFPDLFEVRTVVGPTGYCQGHMRASQVGSTRPGDAPRIGQASMLDSPPQALPGLLSRSHRRLVRNEVVCTLSTRMFELH